VATTTCIWCGERTDEAADGGSFLFLAKGDSGFERSPTHWLDSSPHLEGHQFFCHAACFRASVPEGQQYALLLALDDSE
jgi:hypothetical protein